MPRYQTSENMFNCASCNLQCAFRELVFDHMGINYIQYKCPCCSHKTLVMTGIDVSIDENCTVEVI